MPTTEISSGLLSLEIIVYHCWYVVQEMSRDCDLLEVCLTRIRAKYRILEITSSFHEIVVNSNLRRHIIPP